MIICSKDHIRAFGFDTVWFKSCCVRVRVPTNSVSVSFLSFGSFGRSLLDVEDCLFSFGKQLFVPLVGLQLSSISQGAHSRWRAHEGKDRSGQHAGAWRSGVFPRAPEFPHIECPSGAGASGVRLRAGQRLRALVWRLERKNMGAGIKNMSSPMGGPGGNY